MTRKRSHWAWGWQDSLPSIEARQQLGEVLTAILKIRAGESRETVPLADVKLRPPHSSAILPLALFLESLRAMKRGLGPKGIANPGVFL